jgi:uncharacterized protein YjbI with pentapeptide repeats
MFKNILQQYFPKLFNIFIVSIFTLNLIILPAHALDYTKEDLKESDFSNQNLTASIFNKTNLRNSNFSNANLQEVSFFGANLEGANFENADLTNAVLDSARLTRANLTNAILTGVMATNTKFERAIITGADFTDVLLRKDVQKILCETATGTNPITKRNTRDTLYCN